MTMLTKQEMFDRAWNGLKAQNWERSVTSAPNGQMNSCNYLTRKADGAVIRCAWGHVDPEGTAAADENPDTANKSVKILHQRGVGLAAELTPDDTLPFACALQYCHDDPTYFLVDPIISLPPTDEERVELSMRVLAKSHELTIPGEA